MFDLFSALFPLMFFAVFAIVISMFIVTFVKSISQWSRNNQSPRLTVEAEVVARRQNFHRSNDHGHTSYFATFQVASGDRLELQLDGSEYGMLAEGDRGQLTFQGTRYLGFVRR